MCHRLFHLLRFHTTSWPPRWSTWGFRLQWLHVHIYRWRRIILELRSLSIHLWEKCGGKSLGGLRALWVWLQELAVVKWEDDGWRVQENTYCSRGTRICTLTLSILTKEKLWFPTWGLDLVRHRCRQPLADPPTFQQGMCRAMAVRISFASRWTTVWKSCWSHCNGTVPEMAAFICWGVESLIMRNSLWDETETIKNDMCHVTRHQVNASR